MDRRELLGVLGAGAAGLVALGGGQARADHEGADEDQDHIKTLGECARICDEAAQFCLDELRKGGSHAERHAKAHEAAMDCRAFCVLTATLMARQSPMAKYGHLGSAAACGECATASEACWSEIMRECARVCRECEALCRQMVSSIR